ncbi:MAG: thioredoxin [Chloroflexota bacterium]
MSQSVREVAEGNFDEMVLQSDRPVLVDFWAEWCGPCRALAPTLEAVAQSWGDRAHVVKLNVDAGPEVAARYGVRAIPTLILFKDGGEVERLLGSVSKAEIARKVGQHIGLSSN